MKLLFTRSQLPLSKLIRWGLNEPVSHVAILLDEKLVFQSNLLGVSIEGIYRLQKACEIVYVVDIPMKFCAEEDLYQLLLQQYDGKPYDFKAFAYFAWRTVLYKLFKKPYPNKNIWQDPNSFLCDGLLTSLSHVDVPIWLSKL